MILVPVMIVTRLAIYVRSGAGSAEQGHEPSGGHVDGSDESSTHTTGQTSGRPADDSGQSSTQTTAVWRGVFIGALAVLMAGIGLSVDTDNSEWVIPDPQSGWIGIPLVGVSIGVLALLSWRRWRIDP
jgi:hypothetical protein